MLLGPVGLVGGFFVKGKNIDLPEGATIYVQPQEMVTVQGVVVGGDGQAHTANETVTQDSYDEYTLGDDSEPVTLVPADDTSAEVNEEPEEDVVEESEGTVEEDDEVAEESSEASNAPSQPIVVVKRN